MINHSRDKNGDTHRSGKGERGPLYCVTQDLVTYWEEGQGDCEENIWDGKSKCSEETNTETRIYFEVYVCRRKASSIRGSY